MSQWLDKIRNHPIWKVLEAVGSSIDLAVNREHISPEAIDEIERIRTVITFCGKRLASTDSALMTPVILDNLSVPLNQIKTYLDTYSTNLDISLIVAANAQADSLLSSLTLVHGAMTIDDLTAVAEAGSSYRKTLESNIQNVLAIKSSLQTNSDLLVEKLIGLQSTVALEQQKLSTLFNEQQTLFSTAQDKRAGDFAAIQNDNQVKITAIITEQQTQFSTAQDKRASDFTAAQIENQAKITNLVSEYDEALKNQEATYIAYQKDLEVVNNSKLEEIQREYLNIASQILNQIKTHKSEVESLVGVIGNLGVTSGYKKVADQARVMLYIWQFLTVCALCGLIAVSYMVAFPSHNDIALNAQLTLEKTQTTQDSHVQNLSDKNKDTSNLKAKTDAGVISGKFTDNDFYHGLATRIFLSLTFGIFAAYAGKQASNFLTIEQKNRKLALELEALGPFIEPLDKADRDKFRVQVGDRSFGVPDSDFQKSREDDPVNLAGILKSKGFTDGVSDIVSAIKEAVHK